jgi:AcrR family transcriptional regulator
VSPQRSNRENLIEGALRCLEKLPPEQCTARVIAREAGANIASITYHFGSKDRLLTEAAIAGLDRWLAEIGRRTADNMADVADQGSPSRLVRAAEAVEEGMREHQGLARNYVSALAKAGHDEQIRKALAGGFERSRPQVARLLGFGGDRAGHDAAGLVLAMFHGLLIQRMLDPGLGIQGQRMREALQRFGEVLPDPGGPPARSLTRPDPDTGPSTGTSAKRRFR